MFSYSVQFQQVDFNHSMAIHFSAITVARCYIYFETYVHFLWPLVAVVQYILRVHFFHTSN